MTTFADLIEETRQHLLTGQPDRLNVLQSPVDDSATSVQFLYDLHGVSEGSILSIGLEEMHVIGTSGSIAGSNVEVIRGINGSTPTAHADGTIIRVNPSFTTFRISKYVNQAFHDLSGEGLFRIHSTELQTSANQIGYDLSADNLIDVWRVRYRIPGQNSWPVLHKRQYYVDQVADTDDFPTGVQIVLREGGSVGQPIRVSYKATFDQLGDLPDDVFATTGLHVEAHDLPPFSAAISILAGREIKRSFTNRQPEPRRAEEVPPGAASQSMVPLMREYQRRLTIERGRLKRKYPEQI